MKATGNMGFNIFTHSPWPFPKYPDHKFLDIIRIMV
jgi:hypothetical protein